MSETKVMRFKLGDVLVFDTCPDPTIHNRVGREPVVVDEVFLNEHGLEMVCFKGKVGQFAAVFFKKAPALLDIQNGDYVMANDNCFNQDLHDVLLHVTCVYNDRQGKSFALIEDFKGSFPLEYFSKVVPPRCPFQTGDLVQYIYALSRKKSEPFYEVGRMELKETTNGFKWYAAIKDSNSWIPADLLEIFDQISYPSFKETLIQLASSGIVADGKDLFLSLINPKAKEALYSKQDVLWALFTLEKYRVKSNIALDSEMTSPLMIQLQSSVVMDELSDNVTNGQPLKALEDFCERFNVTVSLEGHDIYYKLGFGMLVYEEVKAA